jgi:hypothetical protein
VIKQQETERVEQQVGGVLQPVGARQPGCAAKLGSEQRQRSYGVLLLPRRSGTKTSSSVAARRPACRIVRPSASSSLSRLQETPSASRCPSRKVLSVAFGHAALSPGNLPAGGSTVPTRPRSAAGCPSSPAAPQSLAITSRVGPSPPSCPCG